MILTLTLNPSVDIAYELATFKLDDVNRVKSVLKTPGGKGLNVTRVLAQMNEPVLASGLLGGSLGQWITQQLDASAIVHDFYQIQGETRNCIAVLHEGKQTEVLEQGPEVTQHETVGFLSHVSQLLNKVDVVVLSGSLPQGLPQDTYVKIIKLCAMQPIPVVLDCSGETLRTTLQSQYKPTVIKPNISELSQLIGQSIDERTASLKEALAHPLFNDIEWIIVSLGSKGAFAKHHDAYYRVSIPTINVLNAVGSGDSSVAGIASSLLHKAADDQLLMKANTLGMLNAQSAQTGYVNMDHYQTLFDKIKVIEV